MEWRLRQVYQVRGRSVLNAPAYRNQPLFSIQTSPRHPSSTVVFHSFGRRETTRVSLHKVRWQDDRTHREEWMTNSSCAVGCRYSMPASLPTKRFLAIISITNTRLWQTNRSAGTSCLFVQTTEAQQAVGDIVFKEAISCDLEDRKTVSSKSRTIKVLCCVLRRSWRPQRM